MALHLNSAQQRMDPGLWGMISQWERESDALDLLSNDRAKSAVKHRQTALQVRGMWEFKHQLQQSVCEINVHRGRLMKNITREKIASISVAHVTPMHSAIPLLPALSFVSSGSEGRIS